MATALLLYFVIAFPLELSKLFALESILLKNPYYEEHYDGVVYAICVGLGNATSMSLLCVIYYRDLFSFTDALFLALFLAMGDYICSVLMGYFYSIYRFEDGRKVAKYRILWWPMVAHFIFFLLFFYVLQPLNEIWTIVCLIALIVICVVLTNYAKKKLLSFWLNKNEKKKDAVTVETP